MQVYHCFLYSQDKNVGWLAINIYLKCANIVNDLHEVLNRMKKDKNVLPCNGPFAASGHMVHAGGQAAHWDIQNNVTSSR